MVCCLTLARDAVDGGRWLLYFLVMLDTEVILTTNAVSAGFVSSLTNTDL